MSEEWRPVPEFDAYEVSSLGRIRRVTPACGATVGKCLKPTRMKSGYMLVTLRKDGKSTYKTVHSIVAAAFIGPRPPGLDVRHGDHVRSNNRADNLEYGTRKENMEDSAETFPRGETHHSAKFSDAEVVAALAEARSIGSAAAARKYGMSQTYLCNVRAGRVRKGIACH